MAPRISSDDAYSPYNMAFRDWLAALYQQLYNDVGSWERVADRLGRHVRKVNRDIAMLKRFGIVIDMSAARKERRAKDVKDTGDQGRSAAPEAGTPSAGVSGDDWG